MPTLFYTIIPVFVGLFIYLAPLSLQEGTIAGIATTCLIAIIYGGLKGGTMTLDEMIVEVRTYFKNAFTKGKK